MILLHKKVKHSKFGIGTIINQEASRITVQFTESIGQKVFQYPEAFEKFLVVQDNQATKMISQELEQKKAFDEAASTAHMAKIERTLKSGSNKNYNGSHKQEKNNIAIKCNFCDGGMTRNTIGYRGACSDEIIRYNIEVKRHMWCCSEESACLRYYHKMISRRELDSSFGEDEFVCYESQMLTNWKTYSGIVQTGDRKGKAMTFRDLSSNMLAVLTTRLPYTSEEDRIIFAVFLVFGRCEGDEEVSGYIEAHPDYRVELTVEEAKKLRFWDFYYNERKPDAVRMGSGLHRYITDVQASQILKKIGEIKKTSSEKAYVENFLKHFCEIKEINLENIPALDGALARIT